MRLTIHEAPRLQADVMTKWVRKSYREKWDNRVAEAVMIWRSEHREAWKRFPLKRAYVCFTLYSKRRPDPTNLAYAFKAPEDALVSAGVLVNDQAENYVGESPEWRWEKTSGKTFITIDIEED